MARGESRSPAGAVALGGGTWTPTATAWTELGHQTPPPPSSSDLQRASHRPVPTEARMQGFQGRSAPWSTERGVKGGRRSGSMGRKHTAQVGTGEMPRRSEQAQGQRGAEGPRESQRLGKLKEKPFFREVGGGCDPYFILVLCRLHASRPYSKDLCRCTTCGQWEPNRTC